MFIRETFFGIEDLIDNIFDSEYIDNMSIYCKYDFAKQVLKQLLDGTDLMPFSISLTDPAWDGYDKEFIISTTEDGIYCEKFYRSDYIHINDDTVFILPDCSDECVKHIKKELEANQPCFKIDFLTDECGENECDSEEITQTYKDGDGNVVGFSTTYKERLIEGGDVVSTFTVFTPSKERLKQFADAFKIDI